MDTLFRKICEDFGLKGEYVSYDIIKSGNINDTYVINTKTETGEKQYIVQRVNTKVFKDPLQIASNIQLVTSHIEKKLRERGDTDIRRKVLRLYRNKKGHYFYIAENGDNWRVLSYVYNSASYNQVTNQILRSAGEAFGSFQRLLLDFPADKLYTTIPDFHNTEKRFLDLYEAAERDPYGRRKEVIEELEYLKSREEYASKFRILNELGEMPQRVTHNDTKCNNVMFDKDTGAPLAVIDLDTVMPGYVAHDFGDAIRFAANTAEEDEEELSKVSLDLDKYESFACGFIPQISDVITKTEFDNLPDGVIIMTLELAARFLTDYLNGDVYFKCRKPKHNLIRAKCQVALAKDIEKKLPGMRRRIAKFIPITP
ncbi:MAG TPA: aminoglycoside phosphotransferase family protein [Bacillota bacterium]|nr:aminoglycoside phosphotransferase family protein [Bacillota bacterium]HOK68015.1 aminoglycoside phosphotransferase family protein [Bacillota bacterium]HPP84561.1 aminoglycoside phosphotransferase family protein [Bacillota bacterium]